MEDLICFFTFDSINIQPTPMLSPHCPFCNLPADRALLAESDMAFAMYDGFPVNPGHALIIPKRHVANYFELSEEEQAACFRLLNDVKAVVEREYRPNGFNVGINVEAAAGQTVGHVHIHLIPRYWGDVGEPRGGVRGVIPGKQQY
jgi:diadenosine tetraphosphate (Ap4A) HIT family hydrolase